jgi:hypothetical protein
MKSPLDFTNFGDAYLKDAGASKLTNGTGFVLTWANVDATTRTIAFMVIKGGLWQSGSETTRTTTGKKSTTTTLRPRLLILANVFRTAVGSAKQDCVTGVGVSDEVNDLYRGGTENDSLGITSTGRTGSSKRCLIVESPITETTTLVEANLKGSGSFNATDFTLDYTKVDGTAYLFIWIVVGNATLYPNSTAVISG